MIRKQYLIDADLAKVGVEGSNPFTRSNDFNILDGTARC
jgi:hypothetical protein